MLVTFQNLVYIVCLPGLGDATKAANMGIADRLINAMGVGKVKMPKTVIQRTLWRQTFCFKNFGLVRTFASVLVLR